jgi:peroxiredoxin Q/BCP
MSMTRKFLSFALLGALASAACAQQQRRQPQTAPAAPAQAQSAPPAAQNTPPAAPKTHLKVGDPAPDFTLSNTKGEKVKLSDFRGKKNVVLAFYVLAFTGG